MASACPASSARVGGLPRRPGGAASVFLPCSLRSGRTAVGSARLPGDAEPGPVTVTYTGPLNSSAFQDRLGSQVRGRGAMRACRGPRLAYGLIAVACVIHGRVLGPHSSRFSPVGTKWSGDHIASAAQASGSVCVGGAGVAFTAFPSRFPENRHGCLLLLFSSSS